MLYADAAARALEPFALTRPVCEFRTGAVLLRGAGLESRAAGLPGAWARRTSPRSMVERPHPERRARRGNGGGERARTGAGCRSTTPTSGRPTGAWPRCVWPPLDAASLRRYARAGFAGSPGARRAAARLVDRPRVGPGAPPRRHARSDIPVIGVTLATERRARQRAHRGVHPVFIEDGAVVEPFVLLDAQHGPCWCAGARTCSIHPAGGAVLRGRRERRARWPGGGFTVASSAGYGAR